MKFRHADFSKTGITNNNWRNNPGLAIALLKLRISGLDAQKKDKK
jgi:hypothetical protein